MRQSFDVKGGPTIGRAHLPLLRDELAKRNLDGLFIPHEDEYQNEYLPDANERLAWATGFTGSAGAAVVLTDQAVVFVDGRYTLQAVDQLAPELFTSVDLIAPGPFNWLAEQDLTGQTIGYDPKLMTPVSVAALVRGVEAAGGSAKALPTNPIDKVWKRRPKQPMEQVVPHELTFAGESSASKREKLGQALTKAGTDAAIITAPSSIAWLFNIRGGDVSYSPLPLGRAVLKADGTADLYLDPRKVTDDLPAHLGNEVAVKPLKDLAADLKALKGQSVSVDPNAASAWFFDTLKRAKADIVEAQDPCALPKACKNTSELKGTERAHERDAVAIIRFLHWLDTEAQSGEKTEIDCVEQLEAFRNQSNALKDLSFDTISGAGANGALPHYRVSSATNLTLDRGTLYLVDSGGQYLDGTTDITRTVPIGTPTDEMKARYTQVLKGHIALAVVRFPAGTTGTHLDTLARHALWQAGLDYEHGTGHGVGSYLGVHEGPQRIAKAWNATPLMPGMIVSNEPGYYKSGEYGIRIENLQYVTPATPIAGGELPMHGFKQVTLAPLARGLIDTALLSDAELDWVNDYHAEVLSKMLPRFDGDETTVSWLGEACAPISR